MTMEYVPLLGEPVAASGLRIPKAQALAALLTAPTPYPFVHLVECRVLPAQDPAYCIGNTQREVVVFDADIEIPQMPANSIRRVERVAAVFRADDELFPEALALRTDFPTDVPHLNIGLLDRPASLCLSDRPWEEDQLRWTARRFVERTREWLALTAEGKLHAEDQPLEPLLSGMEATIILPNDLFGTTGTVPERLYCHRTGGHESDNTMVVIAKREQHGDRTEPARFVAIPLGVTLPATHGVIRRQPANIKALDEFLRITEFDLLSTLRSRVREWQADSELLALVPIFVISLPKRRNDEADAESVDTWAFLADKTLGEVGLEIGVLDKHADHYVPLVGGAGDAAPAGENVPLALMRPYSQFDQEGARLSNGILGAVGNDARIAAVGLGALGSQVFTNLTRAGFGTWSLIDSDILMPHNLARHTLHSTFVGSPKALSLAALANDLMDNPGLAIPVVTNVLRPKGNADKLEKAFSEANMLLDMSASVAVARHLALDHDEVSARRLSVFLSPSGSDLVVLAEDSCRQTRLDVLEMQYYRAIASLPELAGHLLPAEGLRRYGRSCRDLSAVLSQEVVAIHAAIAARAVRNVTVNPDTSLIRIWRTDTDLGVNMITVPVYPGIELTLPGTDWKLFTDTHLLAKVRQLRASKANNETGGVILGSVDTQRRIIYAVDVLLPPPDSEETRTGFVRGSVGLRAEIERVANATAGWVEYIGEWHSHPPGYSATYSRDDQVLFTWLGEQLAPEEHPPVMLIVGEDERWYVESLPEQPQPASEGEK